MADILCVCGSGKAEAECCDPVLAGARPARTPEELIRARFVAHYRRDYAFLVQSTHPKHREDVSEEAIEKWASHVAWQSLDVHSATPGATDDEGRVSFSAHYTVRDIPQELREDSTFVRENGQWFYVDGAVQGQEPYQREAPRVGRNDPCPCGSGKKYKKCCA